MRQEPWLDELLLTGRFSDDRCFRSRKQTIHLSQFWEEPRPKSYYCQSTGSPENYGRNSAEPLRGNPRFELPEFVGGPDEQQVHSTHTSAHRRRRRNLHKSTANDDADHV